jgi:alkyl sulfatase BDS1-like metallo-beta-lactamase superfamily hydrolase
MSLVQHSNIESRTVDAAASRATAATRAAHEQALRDLPDDSDLDEQDARRGFIGTIPDAEVRDAYGGLVWTLGDYGFLDDPQAPETAHPSLWRLARLNAIHGLFEVTQGIYQIRGFDLSNMTVIEGETGLIVIDPLSTKETARAALDLYLQHRPAKPVVAVIYSHSHAAHFGGVKGVVDAADVRAGKVAVIAPAGFMEAAVSENIVAGTAMMRRAQFQFGHTLARNACCQIDSGLGKNAPRGTLTLIEPTMLISDESERHVVDGV